MLQLSHLPPPAIFEHSESLHAITLAPLASFLAHLSTPSHLRTLHEILEKYRTPESYHRIEIREIGSSEIPIDPELEDPIPTVAEEGGNPIFLEAGVTRAAYNEEKKDRESGAEAARQLAEDHPHLRGDSPIPSLPPTFTASSYAPPVRLPPPPPQIDPSLLLPEEREAEAEALYPLPPSAPLRRVRELRLDLRTLDAAALFALETWRRAELGLEKLDLEVPQSIWYKPPTPPPAPAPLPKKKPGRPRKSAPSVPPPASLRSTSQTTRGPGGEEADASLIAALHNIAREDQVSTFSTPVLPPSTSGASAGPGEANRSATPDEILPDAYNQTEHFDPSFIPEPSPALSSSTQGLSTMEEGPRKRGRPSKAEIAARTTILPDGTAVVTPRPKINSARKGRVSAEPAGSPTYGVNSTPRTGPKWAVESSSTSHASGSKPPPKSTNSHADPSDIPPLSTPSHPSASAEANSKEDEMLNPDGSMKHPPPPLPLHPPPAPAPDSSAEGPTPPKKRGRPPKVRPSLDPFGAEQPPASSSPATGLPPPVPPPNPASSTSNSPARGLPRAIQQRVATLQEALASSSVATAQGETVGPEEKGAIAEFAARIVADIGPSPLASTRKGKGKGGKVDATATNPKAKKRKSAPGSNDGHTPMSKRRYMTKEYKEYAEEWAFLKGF